MLAPADFEVMNVSFSQLAGKYLKISKRCLKGEEEETRKRALSHSFNLHRLMPRYDSFKPRLKYAWQNFTEQEFQLFEESRIHVRLHSLCVLLLVDEIFDLVLRTQVFAPKNVAQQKLLFNETVYLTVASMLHVFTTKKWERGAHKSRKQWVKIKNMHRGSWTTSAHFCCDIYF